MRLFKPITLFPTEPARRALAVLLLLGVGAIPANAADWDPVSPKDLAAKDSAINPGADLEILDTRIEFDGSGWNTYTYHTIRAKIYTQKGVNDRGGLDIESDPDERATDIAARVVKPDGRIFQLKKEDFHETTMTKDGDDRWKKTAFAFPDLAPGDIIDLRWTNRLRRGYYYRSFWMYAQDRFPIRNFQFIVLNYPYPYTVSWFNCNGEIRSNDRSTMTLTVRGMPAFNQEELPPPEREFRGWVTLIRTPTGYRNDNEVWKDLSAYWSDDFDDRTKASGLKKKSAEITAGATTDEGKLRRIYEFCQNSLANYDWADSPAIKAAKEKYEEAVRNGDQETRWADNTLKELQGTPEEINGLFAALARAQGLEVREARNADRSELLNIRTPKGWAFLDRRHVAVKVGGQWHFYDPGRGWEPFGLLDWRDEMATMMVCSGEDFSFQDFPPTPAKASPVSRKAHFTLDEEGTLEGEVEESSAGHVGVELKRNNWEKSLEDTNKQFTEALVKRLPSAEVSDLHWENLRNHEFPVTVRYKVRVPGYAEQAGKRLTLAPEFFEAGQPAILAPASRKYPIFFRYARSEHDDVEIVLPEGFQLDHPSAPAKVGDPNSILGADYKIEFFRKRRALHYTRDFTLAGTGNIAFQTQAYPVLKHLFTGLHTSDSHALILRPAEKPAAPSEPAQATEPAPAQSPKP